MGAFRHFLRDRRWLAALVVAATLWIKLLVPAGYMPVLAGGAVYVEPCSGHGVERIDAAMAAMPGMAHGHDRHDGAGKDEPPCGFTGHAPAAMAAADPILLVLAIAFVMAGVVRRPVAPPMRRRAFLRPPLRGPPAIA